MSIGAKERSGHDIRVAQHATLRMDEPVKAGKAAPRAPN